MRISFLLFRKFYHDSLYYVSDSSSHSSTSLPLPTILLQQSGGHASATSSTLVTPTTTLHSACGVSLGGGGTDTILRPFCRTIPAGSFLQHVERLRENQGFRLEFQTLQDWEQKRRSTMEEVAKMKQQQTTSGGGTLQHQKKENRYANVIACKWY